MRITTRDPSSSKAQELAALGAEVHVFDAPLTTVFSGADIVIDVMPLSPNEDRKRVIDAIVASNIKVYFLSEFGSYVLSSHVA